MGKYNQTYSREDAYLMGNFASIVYEDWEVVGLFVQKFSPTTFKIYENGGTEAFLVVCDNFAVLSFRGTEINSIKDWCTDANAILVKESFGRAHMGAVLALDKVWGQVVVDIQKLSVPLFVTGHSLGGGIASLAAGRILKAGGACHAYTFGAMRVADREYAEKFNDLFPFALERYVNNNDFVVALPFYAWGFRHFGVFRYFMEDGLQNDEISVWGRLKDSWDGIVDDIGELGLDAVKDHDRKNYIINLEKNK